MTGLVALLSKFGWVWGLISPVIQALTWIKNQVKFALTWFFETSRALCVSAWKTGFVVFLVVLLIDLIVSIFGGPLARAAMQVGIMTVMSLVLIWFGFNPTTKSKVVRFMALYGAWIDLAATIVLTYVGFFVLGSVMMAMVAMFVGFHVTAICALCRLMWFMKHPEDFSCETSQDPEPFQVVRDHIDLIQGTDGSWSAHMDSAPAG
jgi:hypothetical protein